MQRSIRHLSIGLALFLASFACQGLAQSTPTQVLAAHAPTALTKQGDITADIPFPFVVARQTLPAGRYIVSPANMDSLQIRDANNRGFFVLTQSTQRSLGDNSCKLVFHRCGDTYFLSEVWAAGNSIGRTLFRSRTEREGAESCKQREVAVGASGK
jgi:hypothetical protein